MTSGAGLLLCVEMAPGVDILKGTWARSEEREVEKRRDLSKGRIESKARRVKCVESSQCL